MAAIVAFATIPLPPPHEQNVTEIAAGAALTAIIVAAALFLPWDRLPVRAQAAPPFAFFAVVILLREAEGGGVSGFGPLVLLPVLWLALYGTRGELLVGVGLVAATFLVPLVVLGGPGYPATELREAFVWLVVAPIAGFSVQRLVSEIRERSAIQSAIARVARELPTDPDARRSVCEAACEVSGAPMAFLVEPDGKGSLRSSAMAGIDLPPIAFRIGEEPSGPVVAFASHRPFFVSRGNPAVSQRIVEATGTVSSLYQPLLRGGQAIGVLAVLWRGRIDSLPERAATAVGLARRRGGHRGRTRRPARAAPGARRLPPGGAADIAHELRAPVTGILSRIEAAQDGVMPEPERNLEAVHAEALRLGQLIDDVGALGEAEGLGVLAAAEELDLAEVARERAARYAGRFEAGGIEFDQELERAPVRGDARRLSQVVDNLLSNALRYTDPGGSVTVRVALERGQAQLEVADTGWAYRRASSRTCSSGSGAATPHVSDPPGGPGWASPWGAGAHPRPQRQRRARQQPWPRLALHGHPSNPRERARRVELAVGLIDGRRVLRPFGGLVVQDVQDGPSAPVRGRRAQGERQERLTPRR